MSGPAIRSKCAAGLSAVQTTHSLHTASVIEKNQPKYSHENGKVVSVNTMKKYKVGGAVQLHPFLIAAPV